jgi:hypothetical protein
MAGVGHWPALPYLSTPFRRAISGLARPQDGRTAAGFSPFGHSTPHTVHVLVHAQVWYFFLNIFFKNFSTFFQHFFNIFSTFFQQFLSTFLNMDQNLMPRMKKGHTRAWTRMGTNCHAVRLCSYSSVVSWIEWAVWSLLFLLLLLLFVIQLYYALVLVL